MSRYRSVASKMNSTLQTYSAKEIRKHIASIGAPPRWDGQDPLQKAKRDKKWKKDNREAWLAYKREWNKKRRTKIYREIAKLQKQIDLLRAKI